MKILENKENNCAKNKKICLKCGYPVEGNVCQFCGSLCANVGEVHIEFPKGEIFGTLTVGETTYEVYLGHEDIHTIVGAGDTIVKHKFTVIEV